MILLIIIQFLLEYVEILCYTDVNSRKIDICLVFLYPILGGIMKSKNIKVVDQNKIDRNAFLMFAFDLESSEYVAYSIERDDDESNLFVSKTYLL